MEWGREGVGQREGGWGEREGVGSERGSTICSRGTFPLDGPDSAFAMSEHATANVLFACRSHASWSSLSLVGGSGPKDLHLCGLKG